MDAAPFEHAVEARAALRAIVTDPAHGPAALDDAQIMGNLLSDYLPDAPRETSVLTAASSAGLPSILRCHVADGMDTKTAITLAAAALGSSTALTPETCTWAASELAAALGLNPGPLPPQPPGTPGLPTGHAARDGQTLTATMHLGAATTGTGPQTRRRRPAVPVLAAAAVLAAAVAIIAVVALPRTPSADSPAATPPSSPAAQHRTATACTPATLTRALVAANRQLKSFSWKPGAFACGNGWAVATVNAPSVGFGIAFLHQTTAGWQSDPLSGGAGLCSSTPGALGTPAPPPALAISLLRKAGFCTTPATTPAALEFTCTVQNAVLGNGPDYEVTAIGGAAYSGPINVSFHDYPGSGHIFPPTSLTRTAPAGSITNWHPVPSADIGASAEPSGCTAKAPSS